MGILGAVAAGSLFSTVGKLRRKASGKGSLRSNKSSKDLSLTVADSTDDSQGADEDGGGVYVPCCPSLTSMRSFSPRELSTASGAVAAVESLPSNDGRERGSAMGRHRRSKSRHSLDDSMLRGGIISGELFIGEKPGESMKSGELLVKPGEVAVSKSREFAGKSGDVKTSVPSCIPVPRKKGSSGNGSKNGSERQCEALHLDNKSDSEPLKSNDESMFLSPSGKSFSLEVDSLPVAHVITFPDSSSTGLTNQGFPGMETMAVGTISDLESFERKTTTPRMVVGERCDQMLPDVTGVDIQSGNSGNDTAGLDDVSDDVDEGWEVMQELLTQRQSQQSQQDDVDSNTEFFDAEDRFDGLDCTSERSQNVEKAVEIETKNAYDGMGSEKSAKVLEEAWELVTHLMELEEAISNVGGKESDGSPPLSSEQFEAMFGNHSDFERSLDQKHRRWFTDYSDLCELSTSGSGELSSVGSMDRKALKELVDALSGNMERSPYGDITTNADVISNLQRRYHDASYRSADNAESNNALESTFRDGIIGEDIGGLTERGTGTGQGSPAQGSPLWSDGEVPVDADLAEGEGSGLEETLNIEMSPSDASALAEALASVPLVTCPPRIESGVFPVTKLRVSKEGLPLSKDGVYETEICTTCWFRGEGGDTSDDEWDTSSPSSSFMDGSFTDDMNLEEMIEIMENVIAERSNGENLQPFPPQR